MTKKHFIALADMLRAAQPGEYHGRTTALGRATYAEGFQNGRSAEWHDLRDRLADFAQSQNPNFNRQRWLDYIDGKVGPNGGANLMNIDQRCYGYEPAASQLKSLRDQNKKLVEELRQVRGYFHRNPQVAAAGTMKGRIDTILAEANPPK